MGETTLSNLPQSSIRSDWNLEQGYLEAFLRHEMSLRDEDFEEGEVSLRDVYLMLHAIPSWRDVPAQRRQERLTRDELPSGAKSSSRLGTQQLGATEEGSSNEIDADAGGHPMLLSEVLKERHLVLLGEPGAGKSTTLQFIGLCCAKGAWAQELLGADEEQVPVRLHLPQVAERIKSDPLDHAVVAVVQRVSRLHSADASRLVESWAQAGRLTLLLDGLDEVRGSDRPEIIEEIRRFATSAEGERCRVVVASRLVGYSDLGHPFVEYLLSPLQGNEETFAYVKRWLMVLAKLSPEAAEDRAHGLVEQIAWQPALNRVADNPLMLRLLISLYISSGYMELVLRNRADVYQRYLEEVAWKRGLKRADPPAPLEAVFQWLHVISWSLHAKGPLTEDELVDEIHAKCAGAEDARGLLEFLRKGMGVLAKYEEGLSWRIDFIYSTLREYFVSRQLRDAWQVDLRSTWLFLRPRLHHPRWREPVLLLSSMLSRGDATALLRRILNARSDYERELHRDLLLAGECVRNGATVAPRLCSTILRKSLDYYVKVKAYYPRYPFDETTIPALERSVAQPIERMFAYLASDGIPGVLESVLAVARGDTKTDRSVLRPPGRIRLVRQDFRSLISRFIEGLAEGRGFPSPSEIIRMPTYFKETSKQAEILVQLAAVRLVGKLHAIPSEAIDALMKALRQPHALSTAAEVLGRVGPGTDELVTALLDVQRQYCLDHRVWDDIAVSISEALGVLGQRHPEVSERLLAALGGRESSIKPPVWEYWDYAIALAVCKCAEVNASAMHFFLSGRRNHSLLSRELREALKDGRRLIGSVSPEVIQLLLGVLRSSEDQALRSEAGWLLADLVGDTPQLRLKVIYKDGTLRYETVDLAEELFRLLRERPFGDDLSANWPLSLLARWGLRKPQIIARLIEAARDADARLLAKHLDVGLRDDADAESLRIHQDSVGRLAHPDKTIRLAEFERWMRESEVAPKDSFFQVYLPRIISREKASILYGAYIYAISHVWSLAEEWNPQRMQDLDPCAIAALASFRGWRWSTGQIRGPVTRREMEKEFLYGTQLADAILRDCGEHAIRMLSSIFAGEGAKKACDQQIHPDLEDPDGLESEEQATAASMFHNENRPDFRERIAAVYALAHLAGKHADAQAILVRRCEKLLLDLREILKGAKELKFSSSEFHDHLVRALGYVRNARPDLLATILEFTSKYDNYFYGAGTLSLQQLKTPTPESVPVLVEGYSRLDQWKRFSLIRALGSIKPPGQDVIGLLQDAIKDSDERIRSAAAMELGRCDEPAPKIDKALLATLAETPSAAEAIGARTERIARSSGKEGHPWLHRYAKALRRTWNRRPAIVGLIGRSYRDTAYSALNLIATELAIAAADNLDPCLSAIAAPARSTPSGRFWHSARARLVGRDRPILTLVKLLAAAIYFALWALLPNILAGLFPTSSVGPEVRIALIVVFLLLTSVTVWFWLREARR